jgi:hypothetical protein
MFEEILGWPRKKYTLIPCKPCVPNKALASRFHGLDTHVERRCTVPEQRACEMSRTRTSACQPQPVHRSAVPDTVRRRIIRPALADAGLVASTSPARARPHRTNDSGGRPSHCICRQTFFKRAEERKEHPLLPFTTITRSPHTIAKIVVIAHRSPVDRVPTS